MTTRAARSFDEVVRYREGAAGQFLESMSKASQDVLIRFGSHEGRSCLARDGGPTDGNAGASRTDGIGT